MTEDAPSHIRPAATTDIPRLAHIWFEGWHKAHHDTLPEELRQYRTEASFAVRLEALIGDVRVLVCDDEPGGFTILKSDELYQFYVALDLIGTGAAGVLMADAEAELRARGYETAILNCAAGNARAERFYEKSGWRNAGVADIEVDAGGRPFALKALRFEKHL